MFDFFGWFSHPAGPNPATSWIFWYHMYHVQYFHLDPWGRWTHFDVHIFSTGLVQPPTSFLNRMGEDEETQLNGCHVSYLLRGATKVMVKASCIYMRFANPDLNNDSWLELLHHHRGDFLDFHGALGKMVNNHAIDSLNTFLQMDFWGDDCFLSRY